MITKVCVRDNKKSPITYLESINAFSNGKVFEFNEGPNIIVGENGCGKSTLLRLIRKYHLIEYIKPDIRKCSELFYMFDYDNILDGIDVYGDYKKATFNLCRADEYKMNSAFVLNDFDIFGSVYSQRNSSTGEGIMQASLLLLNTIFGKETDTNFPVIDDMKRYHLFADYIKDHTVDCNAINTILLDEPDRNLSLENLKQIKALVSYRRDDLQTISVIHNPLLISAVSHLDVNIIEMTDDYVDKVNEQIKKLANQL